MVRRSPGSGRREKLAATSGRLMRLPVNVPLLYGFACPLLRDYVAFYVSFGPVKFGFSLFVIRLVSAVPPVDLRFPPRSEFVFFLIWLLFVLRFNGITFQPASVFKKSII